MKITQNAAVVMHYTLTDDAGSVVDSSRDQDPLSYIHGSGGLIPGLAAELEGRCPGDQVHAVIPPELAYGDLEEDLIQVVPRSAFPGIEAIEVGMRFTASDQQGQQQTVSVTEVEADEVTVDGNHPLAGQTLHFDVEILSVRAATEEEIDHGHLHS